MVHLSITIALTVLTTMSRSLLNPLEKKDAVWNWVAKGLSPLQTAGRGDGTITSIGVSTIPFAWVALNRDIPITFHHFMLKQPDRKGGDMNGEIGDRSGNEN